MSRIHPAGAGLLLFLSALLPAQTPRNSCSDCKTTGFRVCKTKDCNEAVHCGIKTEHRCDALCSAKCCRGLHKTVCQKCKDPLLEVDVNAEIEARIGWLERMRKFDDLCRTRFSHVETERWTVHCSFPDWKVGLETLSRSRATHLFAERLENCSIKLEGVLGVPAGKHEAFLVWTQDEQMRTTLETQGRGVNNFTFKLYNTAGRFTTRPMPGMGGSDLGTRTDEGLHAHVLHTGTHMVLQGYARSELNRNFAPWFDEALCHWLEIELFKRQATFCFNELNNNKDPWRSSDWKKQIFGEVSSKKEEQFANLITYQDDKLTPRDKAHCWSYVEYMIRAKPKEFQTFFRELKSTNDTKKSLDKAFGWSTAAFQEKWREYVLKTYAP
jgi:hypothetical protein